MKNKLCNLVKDMLSNWVEAHDSILSMKTRMAEIDSHLTAMDNSFSWKGTRGISGHGGLYRGGHDRGGGGSGSATGGMVFTSHGGCGNGRSIGCTMIYPPSPPFPIPLTVEPLFKCLKEMYSQNP